MNRKRCYTKRKLKFTQPTLPIWLDVLLDQAWSQEASILIDQWLKNTEQHFEEQNA